MRVDEIERSLAERQRLAVGDEQSCAGSLSSAKFLAASAIEDGARSTPVTFAP